MESNQLWTCDRHRDRSSLPSSLCNARLCIILSTLLHASDTFLSQVLSQLATHSFSFNVVKKVRQGEFLQTSYFLLYRCGQLNGLTFSVTVPALTFYASIFNQFLVGRSTLAGWMSRYFYRPAQNPCILFTVTTILKTFFFNIF